MSEKCELAAPVSKRSIEESLPNFPLLARISEFYRDAAFAPGEIDFLEEELTCAAALPLTDHGQAFLHGMLKACRMANEEKMGIRLLSS